MTGPRRYRASVLAALSALCLGGLASLPAPAAPPAAMARVTAPSRTAPLTEREKTLHLLNRFAYGPRPGDMERVMSMGADRWFQQQLNPDSIPDALVQERLSQLRSLSMAPIQLVSTYPLPGQIKKLAEKGIVVNQDMVMGGPRDILIELSDQKVVRASESERQLQEVMADFWENHFNINWTKNLDRYLLTDYDLNVIRPHALGRFGDLLKATAHSPAMMVYLDNYVSSKNDPDGTSKRKLKGLNENYARELMELHTLGVDGGYTQHDVVEVARCLTGWSIERPKDGSGAITFMYRPFLHDEGQKVVLGHVTIPAGGGQQDGEQVLDILIHHPSTAHFIATKLCRRFVSDTPPEALVKRVAATYMQTDGDIRAMLTTLYRSPEFWSPEAYRAKIKTPFEMIVSSLRAVNGHLMDGKNIVRQLAEMGEGLYLCEPPTGYKDVAEAWVSSGALLQRLNFSLALSEGRVAGVLVDLTPVLAPVKANDPNGEGNVAAVDVLSQALLHADVSTSTRQSLEQAMTENKLDYTKLVGLLLGSPEFQRR